MRLCKEQQRTSHNQYQCFVDLSWTQQWQGGIGFVLHDYNRPLSYRSARVSVFCPFQAEAVVLKEAVRYVMGVGIEARAFETDNKVLAEVL